MSDWIDVSMPIHTGMVVWPGDAAVQVERAMRLEDGDAFNLTHCNFTAHTGTHMDAPRHFVPGGAGIDSLPLDAVLGPCRVVGIRDRHSIQPSELPADLKRGDRILFKTRNSADFIRSREFHEDFVAISQPAARALVDAGVRTVGIDYLSVGGFHHEIAPTHLILLEAGVWIIEGLDLSAVEPGCYELACLPLRLIGADGAPARAALRRMERP